MNRSARERRGKINFSSMRRSLSTDVNQLMIADIKRYVEEKSPFLIAKIIYCFLVYIESQMRIIFAVCTYKTIFPEIISENI